MQCASTCICACQPSRELNTVRPVPAAPCTPPGRQPNGLTCGSRCGASSSRTMATAVRRSSWPDLSRTHARTRARHAHHTHTCMRVQSTAAPQSTQTWGKAGCWTGRRMPQHYYCMPCTWDTAHPPTPGPARTQQHERRGWRKQKGRQEVTEVSTQWPSVGRSTHSTQDTRPVVHGVEDDPIPSAAQPPAPLSSPHPYGSALRASSHIRR